MFSNLEVLHRKHLNLWLEKNFWYNRNMRYCSAYGDHHLMNYSGNIKEIQI